jgi:PfaD family protein
VIAKVSRAEVATRFFSPPPDKILADLVRRGAITADQAEMARTIPVAQDLTAEADSGGHTDNRPAITLLPAMLALRDEIAVRHGYRVGLRVGAAGGIATPSAVAAAFAMGADYVMGGSVHQSCVESGTCDLVRNMLVKAGQADVSMAPAADMFEMGVKVQVLKRGTLFAMRAARLYDAYRQFPSLEEIPEDVRGGLEKEILAKAVGQVWDDTRAYFERRDPTQIARAQRDPKHKMALVFRWYLGQASRWANSGEPSRRMDYQIWCGPAMGAFNEWAKGSFLEGWKERRVVTVALNLMVGAAILTRAQVLRVQGVTLAPKTLKVSPMKTEEIQQCLA